MSGVLRLVQRPASIGAIAYFVVGAFAAVMFVGAPNVPLSGSTLGLAAALALAIGPFALVLSVGRPLVVPFAIWAALVPVDSLLTLGAIGRLGKPLGAGAALAALIGFLVYRRAVTPPRAVVAWCAVVLLAFTSLAWTSDLDLGSRVLSQLAGLLLVGGVLSMVAPDTKDLLWLFYGVVGGGVGASLRGLAQFALTGDFFVHTDTAAIDHNHFGAALLLPTIVATMASIAMRSPFKATLGAVAAAICIAGIGVSHSRGALIAFGIALLYMFWRSPHRWRLLQLVAIGAILLVMIPGVFARFHDPTAGDAAGRFEIWRIAFSAFSHHWFVGTGFGSFLISYQTSFLDVYQPSSIAQQIQNSHNIFVDQAVEQGIVGVLLLLFAWWAQFRTCRVIREKQGGWADARVAMEATTLAMFISSMSLDLMTFKYTWLAFTVMWVVRAAYLTQTSPRQEEEAAEHGG